MKRSLLSAILVAALAGLLPACGGAQPQASNSQATPVKTDDKIIAEAKVVPARRAALSFQIGGTIAGVLVKEGDQISAGQAIARLDDATRAVNLARAEAQLKAAEARLQDLTDGPRQEDIAAAQAQLRQAQAQLKQTLESVTPEDIASAQAQIEAAQATLARLRAGSNSSDVRAIQAQLQQAQASLAAQRDQLSAGKTNAELQLRQAADRLVEAQTAYSTTKYQWEYVERTGNDPINPSIADATRPGKTKANKLNDFQRQQYHDAFVQVQSNLNSAELAVQQARVAAESARQGEINGLQAAEASVTSAQANLERTMSAVLSEQLAQARSQLAQTRASLTRLRGVQRDNQIAIMQAAVDAAQANLARITAPPQPSELTALEAQVEAAKAERDAAKIELDQAELKAPFNGLIAALDVRVGETISPNTAVAQLADTTSWQIETTDLTELSVTQVHAGDRVQLTFDALPKVELSGRVLQVKEFGENHQGDIVYRAIVVPDKVDTRLRWNMTASAAISPSTSAASATDPPR
ncbi:MAG TPA: HlyD family efflux transporter periplasmic adaptor subunit [Roseiflexaceae bacterium]|nr:HlyD family efflux transporter periplasmic adaptor subunit [Roseiflexaceae bacterium]